MIINTFHDTEKTNKETYNINIYKYIYYFNKYKIYIKKTRPWITELRMPSKGLGCWGDDLRKIMSCIGSNLKQE